MMRPWPILSPPHVRSSTSDPTRDPTALHTYIPTYSDLLPPRARRTYSSTHNPNLRPHYAPPNPHSALSYSRHTYNPETQLYYILTTLCSLQLYDTPPPPSGLQSFYGLPTAANPRPTRD